MARTLRMQTGDPPQDTSGWRAASGQRAIDTEVLLITAVLLIARAPDDDLAAWVGSVLCIEEQRYYTEVGDVLCDAPLLCIHCTRILYAYLNAVCALACSTSCCIRPAFINLAPPITGFWAPKGGMRRLATECLTQEVDVLEAAAVVMYEGVRAGQVACLLPASALSSYVWCPRDSKRLLAPQRAGSKRAGPPQQFAEVVRIAHLLRLSRKELLAKYAQIYRASGKRLLTKAELVEKYDTDKARLEDENTTLGVQKLRAAETLKRAIQRAKVSSAAKKNEARVNPDAARKRSKLARKAIAKAAKEGAKQAAKQVGETAQQATAEALTKLCAERDRARAKARKLVKALGKSKEVSEARLTRARAAEEWVEELKALAEKLHERIAALLTAEQQRRRPKAETLARQQAMPLLSSQLAAGSGPGGKALPMVMRVLVYGELSRLTPPRAVGHNITAVVRCVAPWHPCTEPSFDVVCKMRIELTVIGEMLDARQVAELVLVISFGFDETSKFQLGTLSFNVQGVAADGRTVDIVMRGTFVIAGCSTAEHVVNAVETKLSSRGWRLLARWLDKFNDVEASAAGADEWSGPQPSALALHRLAGSLVMSDTCNAACATKRRLAAVVEAAAQNATGEATWGAMGEAERAAAVRVYTGDCAQHVRNIILGAMSAAGAAHLKNELEESLAEFMAFERIISTDVSALFRAIYKKLHDEGTYAKGKGRREFIPWLQQHHGATPYIPLERADSGRQDLDFDGDVPIYFNRKVYVELLKSLIFQLDHSNILEDFIWTVLRSTEMVAFVRVCTLVDVLISRPMRWLAVKATQLDDWSGKALIVGAGLCNPLTIIRLK
eukprot:6212125-Pleurochrysis_carterae.AAC.6